MATTPLPRGKDEFKNPPFPPGGQDNLTEEVTSAYLDARDGHLLNASEATWDAIRGVYPVARQKNEEKRK